MFLLLLQICDDTNQAKGFSIIGATTGIGRLTVFIQNYNVSEQFLGIKAQLHLCTHGVQNVPTMKAFISCCVHKVHVRHGPSYIATDEG